MTRKDLFLGMHYVDAKFVEEAEAVTELKRKGNFHFLYCPRLIAVLLILLQCAVIYMPQ